MFVSTWLLTIIVSFGGFGILCFIVLIWCCISSVIEYKKVQKRLREQRLLKIEKDIRYLKGIGGIENE